MCIRDRFEGKLTGNAIRVPTPDVSMAVLNLQFEREVTREEICLLYTSRGV